MTPRHPGSPHTLWGALIVLLAVPPLACGGQRSFSDPQVLGGQTVQPDVLNRGRHVYNRHCASCHGYDGRGDTPGGRALSPPPRDLSQADFKYGGDGGALPTDEQMRRIVRDGIPGTGMPAFPNIGDRDVHAVLQFLKTFSPRWREETTQQLHGPRWEGEKALRSVLPGRPAAAKRPHTMRGNSGVIEMGDTPARHQAGQEPRPRDGVTTPPQVARGDRSWQVRPGAPGTTAWAGR